jgi:hypothetical protein
MNAVRFTIDFAHLIWSRIFIHKKPTGFKRSLAFAILGILVVGFSVRQTRAREVPFSAVNVIDGAFDGSYSVCAADIDGDGDLDVLGAAGFGDDVTWWENTNGDGTAWTQHIIDGNFDYAVSVHAADVDGDGDLDVLGAAYADNAITWWENTNGDGTAWTKHTVDGNFNGAYSVYAADVDGDSDLDVLGAAFWDNEISWWENDEATTWTKHTVDGSFAGAGCVYAADVDGDGDVDVLGSAYYDSAITWWENTNGTGTAWTMHTVSASFAGATSVYAADVDGDGDMDILGTALNADDITWWENTSGDGTAWSEHTVEGNFDGAYSVYAADVDGDGDMDVLGTAYYADEITWWENKNGDGSVWTEHAIDGSFDGANAVYAADVDGDGDLDVLGAARDANDIAWWENKTIHRSASFPREVTVGGSFTGAYHAYAADVDGDGDLDVLGAAGTDDDITWWENTNGDGTAWTAHTIEGNFDKAHFVYAADVDGDGDLDVIGAAVEADDITWWENTNGDGTAWTGHTVDGNFDGASSVYAADMDRDGDVDILGTAQVADEVAWWENMNDVGTSWTKHTVAVNFDYALSPRAADLDGDGDLDILAAARDGGDIAWWENTNGDGTAWTEHTVDGNFDGANSAFAADIDGDGDLDIAGAAGFADEMAWWENTNGVGTAWTKHTVGTNFDYAVWVYPADLDSDGDLDIVGAAYVDNKIAWWENTNGDGTTWTEHIVDSNSNGAYSVDVADIDGDGALDIVRAAFWDNDITWYKNRGGQFKLATTDSATTTVIEGQMDDILTIVVTHDGRTSDTDIELASLELLFEQSAGVPLTSAEANAIIENLYVYLDDGSGTFESGSDTLTTTVSTLVLTDGVQTIPFTDGDPNVQIAYGTPKTYFVVVKLTSNAASQSPNQFRITHVTESSSTAEDRDHDIPLSLEFAPNVSSHVLTITSESTPTPTPTPSPTPTPTPSPTPTATPTPTPSPTPTPTATPTATPTPSPTPTPPPTPTPTPTPSPTPSPTPTSTPSPTPTPTPTATVTPTPTETPSGVQDWRQY